MSFFLLFFLFFFLVFGFVQILLFLLCLFGCAFTDVSVRTDKRVCLRVRGVYLLGYIMFLAAAAAILIC